MSKKIQSLVPDGETDEVALFERDLTPEEVFILGFLKGFNRKNSQQWSERELGVFQNSYYYYL